jgi:hypothetical protein
VPTYAKEIRMNMDVSELITITIKNNVEYVNEYEPENIEYIEDDDEVLPIYPYEVDLSARNYKTLWCGLGLPINLDLPNSEIYGEIYPNKLLNAIKNAWIELCVKEDYQYYDKFGNLVKCRGLDEVRIKSIFKQLRNLALEANRRKEHIIWA